MAPPQSESVLTSFPMAPFSGGHQKQPRLSKDNLKRTISDIAFQLSKEIDLEIADSSKTAAAKAVLPAISEAAEDAKCECCGMSEEYTLEYVRRVRDQFCGKWICGLCSEAVKAEMEKNGGNCREALDSHMNTCARFNNVGRAYPVLCQADAMKEILKKSMRLRAKSMNPRDHLKGGPTRAAGIMRSSSCIPAITKDLNDLKLMRN